ncbi:MAG TPA: phosphoesterase, partial [Edaphobacter sp.]|nr:phosphoesterase [Edaphobacter sp.]
MKTRICAMGGVLLMTGLGAAGSGWAWGQTESKPIDLPTSKLLLPPVPGGPQKVNSLPISMAVSPDRRYVVTINVGYGTYESRYMQSLSVLDTQTGKVEDFPEDWTLVEAKQTLYSGLAFSQDGSHIYASLGSETDPEGDGVKKMGSGIIVYGFRDGKVSREKLLKIPLQQLAPGRKTMLKGSGASDKGVPFPADIAVVHRAGEEKLLVADNLSDDVLLMDAKTGAVEKRFDLSESNAVPSTYPVALAVTKDESRVFVALWNSSEVVELDLKKDVVARKLALLKPTLATAAGTHPVFMQIAPDGSTMYVA